MLRKIAPWSMWIALLFVVIGMVMLGYLPAHASTNRTIHFEFTYPANPLLAGFKVYHGKEVFLISDPSLRQIDHLYPLLEDTKACFSMTAVDITDRETSHGPAFCLDTALTGSPTMKATDVTPKPTPVTGASTTAK